MHSDLSQAERHAQALAARHAAEDAADNAARFVDPTIPVANWEPLDDDVDKRWVFTGSWEWMNFHDIWMVSVKYLDTDGTMQWT